jgi:ATP-dependent helicase YprA (DUF1998 family)
MEQGAVCSSAWIEATPVYTTGGLIGDLGLPRPVSNLLLFFAHHNLGVFERPWAHQATAVQAFFNRNMDLVVSTGTGSGKTEVFLYSILGQLGLEANRQRSTAVRGIRAIILYPMNALVADQLARLRKMFGSHQGSQELRRLFGRSIQFGMYTSRTPYHGPFDPVRNNRLVRPIVDYYCNLQAQNNQLFQELQNRGKIPSKDLQAFRSGNTPQSKFRTHEGDVELFTRQEMHDPENRFGGTPDILITNYSMLEYMLLRPIEQRLFQATREWLGTDPQNTLLVVIDEAHLYRGAQGAEVALLLRRLMQHLEIPRNRVRFILTSASLGSEESARRLGPMFGAQLTGGAREQFEVITGTPRRLGNGLPGELRLADPLSHLEHSLQRERISAVAQASDWPPPPDSEDEIRRYLGLQLLGNPTFRLLHDALSTPQQLESLAQSTFPTIPMELAQEATLNLLFLGAQAWGSRDQNLMPARLHLFFKGLPRLYTCINPRCTGRRADNGNLLGRFYTRPVFQCECGARVFELMSHRMCGAAYLRAYRRIADRQMDPQFLWSDKGEAVDLEEIHILLESPRSDPDPHDPHLRPLSIRTQSRYLDLTTGHLIRNISGHNPERFIQVWIPGPHEAPTEPRAPWSWARCPACGIIQQRRPGGLTYIMDLETKGEEPFANLVRTLFQFQPEAPGREMLPNRGKKVLCFSDGRQKAARLARDLQRTVELDSFREVVVASINSLPPDATLDFLFPAFLVYTAENRIAFFDDSDHLPGDGYEGSRTHFVRLQHDLPTLIQRYGLTNLHDLINEVDVIEELNSRKPRMFNEAFLRLLGSPYFSITASLVGFLVPRQDVFDAIRNVNSSIPPQLLQEMIIEILRYAALEQAIDPRIEDRHRRQARSFPHERRGGEGLVHDELIPEYIRERVQGSLTAPQIQQLANSLMRSFGTVPRLFRPLQNSRYVINPSAVRLQIALNHPWQRCQGCRQFFPYSLAGRCPECNGTIGTVPLDDDHLGARKSFLRDPCSSVLDGSYRPFSLRSEEHSAQLTYKDFADIFSKTEEYELLFQDIIISQRPFEQPVDVLSSTTTMEVGIDIGSLTGVAMRTVPPRPENYQQRAGRAGRRGAALSTIITFSDNSPHETYVFENPHHLVGASASDPILYIGNVKICQRHLNASLLQRFFHRHLIVGVPPAGLRADVFSSLGRTTDFASAHGDYSLTEFRRWIQNDILPADSTVVRDLATLLPSELQQVLPEGPSWRLDFVRHCATEFLAEMDRRTDSWINADPEDFLLSTLLDSALLPTFSFPIDLCTFTVREWDNQSNRVAIRYEMSQDLTQALSEYIPGRQIVVDKKTYTSYGLYFRFPSDPIDRATGTHWHSLEWLNFCERCQAILADNTQDLSAQRIECPIPQCHGPVRSLPLLRPEGFSPEVDPSSGAREAVEREEPRIYATPANYPLPVTTPQRATDETALPQGTVRRLSNQELLVVNFGPESGGFEVCTRCGAVGEIGSLPTPHNRPYPRDRRIHLQGRRWPDRCPGGNQITTFGYRFSTDLTVIQLRFDSPMNFAPGESWFNTAARTLSEALVLGTARALGIDGTEIAGNYRSLPRFPTDTPNTRGYIEFFLYDTTPGGAGFASRAYDRMMDVIAAANTILRDCTCAKSCESCLRTVDNKIWHGTMDRYLGGALLACLEGRGPPTIDGTRSHILSELLNQSLELMVAGVIVREEGNGIWVASRDGRQVRFGFDSMILDAGNSAARGCDFLILDYNVLNRLPEVAHMIASRLR